MAIITIAGPTGEEAAIEVAESLEQIWMWLTAPGFFVKLTCLDSNQEERPIIISKRHILTVAKTMHEK